MGAPTLAASPAVPAELARFGRVANGAPFVVALGTIEPRKNLPHLIAAFAPVVARHDDLHLVLAGPDGPARPEVDARLERLPPEIHERVMLTGAVSEPAKSWLLHNAAMVAYPSVYEGFGFPILEAMAAGVPVVAAKAGSIPEIAGDAAQLVEPTDEDAIGQAIERLLDDDERRAELVQRGRARVSEFSWHSTATTVARLYRELAGDMARR